MARECSGIGALLLILAGLEHEVIGPRLQFLMSYTEHECAHFTCKVNGKKEKQGPAIVSRGHLHPNWGRHPPCFEVLRIGL